MRIRIRGCAWCVVRGAWCVMCCLPVRGAWCVVCDVLFACAWCVVRGVLFACAGCWHGQLRSSEAYID